MAEERNEERTYHRIESLTQTPEDARLQEESGEVWGRAARGSDIPKVKAYAGPLPSGKRGIEFVTSLRPDFGGARGSPQWSGTRDGVELDGEFAKIKVRITKNTQT